MRRIPCMQIGACRRALVEHTTRYVEPHRPARTSWLSFERHCRIAEHVQLANSEEGHPDNLRARKITPKNCCAEDIT
jgi:hypothetical protein